MTWTEIRYISQSEYNEIKSLQALWGMEIWRTHCSRELVRLYDLEADRQKMISGNLPELL